MKPSTFAHASRQCAGIGKSSVCKGSQCYDELIMTLAVEKASKPRRVNGHSELIVRDNVSWEEYEQMLHDPQWMRKRMTYDEGRLVIMSPLPRHEHEKRLIGRMAEMLAFELDI